MALQFRFGLAIGLLCFGCTGAPKDPVTQSNPGSVLKVLGNPVPEDCPNGGFIIGYGIDENANGVLDDDEVDATETVCHGADGKDGVPGPPGEAGPQGNDGAAGEPCTATDNGNGTYAIECPDGTRVTVSDGAAGAQGPRGDSGQAGSDGEPCTATDNSDGTYTIACPDGSSITLSDGTGGADGTDGTDGTDGADGYSALISLDSEVGNNCVGEGTRIQTGLDNGDGGGVAHDGILQPGEVDSSAYICDSAGVGNEPSDGTDAGDPTGPSATMGRDDLAVLGSLNLDSHSTGNGGLMAVDLSPLLDREMSQSTTYQWYANGLPVAGAVSQSLSLRDYSVEGQEIHYTVDYYNDDGELISARSTPVSENNWRIFSGGEDGTVAGDNPTPFWETYSYNDNSVTHETVDGVQQRFQASDIHSITSVLATDHGLEAREGDYVLRFHGDSSSYGSSAEKSYTKRVELGSRDWNTRLQEDVPLYFSASIYLPKTEWDPVTAYSTIIFQHKQYPGADPNFELRLSNEGDYQLFAQSPYGHYGLSGDRHNDHPIATLLPDTWHDLRIHLVPSQNATIGYINIYLDGVSVFQRDGTNLNDVDSTNDSFFKCGMYTNIRDERVIFFDAVEMADHITTDVISWATSGQHLPTISFTNPMDGTALNSGEVVELRVDVSDPAGNKLYSTGEIVKVEYFLNGVSLGFGDDTDHGLTLIPEDGPQTVRAVVTDADGNTSSDTINVLVGNQRPVLELVGITAGENFSLNELVTLRANASDPDGTVASVDYWANTDFLGTATSADGSEFGIAWTPTEAGPYVISARATDDAGDESDTVSVGVKAGAVLTNASLVATQDAVLVFNGNDTDGNPSSLDGIENWSGNEIYGGTNKRALLLKFDISSLGTAAEVDTATLNLNCDAVSKIDDNPPSPRILSFYVASHSTWAESDSAENAPSRGNLIATTDGPTSTGPISVEISDFLESQRATGDGAISIWVEVPDGNYDQLKFSNRTEGLLAPAISVVSSSIRSGDTTNIDGDGEGIPNVTHTFYPIQDASIRQDDDSYLWDGSRNIVKGSSSQPIIALVEFDVGSINGDNTVTSAVFRPYVDELLDESASTFSLYSTSDQSWEQSEVKWSTRPAKGQLIDTITITESGSFVDFDVTTAVQAAISQGQTTLTLWIEDSEQEGELFKFDSVNGGSTYPNKPELHIISAVGPDQTAPSFVSASTSMDGSRVILTYDETLSTTTPTAGQFTVTVDGTPISISSVTTSGSTLELILTVTIYSGQSVTIAYQDPSPGDDTTAAQDSAGNDASTVATTSVINRSSRSTAIRLLGSLDTETGAYSHNGGTLAVDIDSRPDIASSPSISYQWHANNQAIAGATAQTLNIENFGVEGMSIKAQVTHLNEQGLSITEFTESIDGTHWRIFAGAEDGTIAGDNPVPYQETYSYNWSSATHEDINGEKVMYTADDIVNITSVLASDYGLEAREGNRVLRFYGDSSNWVDRDVEVAPKTFARRVELGSKDWNTRFLPDENAYLSFSIYAPKSEWDPITQGEIDIYQHRQRNNTNGGDGTPPNFALKLSNEGDYKLYIKSQFEFGGLTGIKRHIATLKPDTWHDIKLHIVPSRDQNTGYINIYLDGESVFEATSKTLNDEATSELSLFKVGMYTNIRDERYYFMDAVEMATYIPGSVSDWVAGLD